MSVRVTVLCGVDISDAVVAWRVGTYKPRMKIWDLAELTVKTERFLDCEAVDFLVCTADVEIFLIAARIDIGRHMAKNGYSTR